MVTDCDGAGRATLTLKNKFRAGDTVELIGPDVRPFPLTVSELWDETGAAVEEVRTPRSVFSMQLPCPVPAFSFLRRKMEP